MIKIIEDVMNYPFLRRAFLAGFLISFCIAILGVNLVLKRYSMIGDTLSHVGFSAFSVSCAMNWAPFFVAMPVVVLAAIFLLVLNKNSKMKGDAVLALFSNSFLAVGVIIISATTGMNTDVLTYMFGSILTLNSLDLILCFIFSFLTIFVFIFLYNKMFVLASDEDFAKAIGIKVKIYNLIIAIITAVTIVLSMKMVGALLISSMIIFPVLTSKLIFNSYKKVVIFSAFISISCFMLGFFVAYFLSLPTGACIVVCDLILFFIFKIISLFKNKSI